MLVNSPIYLLKSHKKELFCKGIRARCPSYFRRGGNYFGGYSSLVHCQNQWQALALEAVEKARVFFVLFPPSLLLRFGAVEEGVRVGVKKELASCNQGTCLIPRLRK